jgi:hypothetical protein
MYVYVYICVCVYTTCKYLCIFIGFFIYADGSLCLYIQSGLYRTLCTKHVCILYTPSVYICAYLHMQMALWVYTSNLACIALYVQSIYVFYNTMCMYLRIFAGTCMDTRRCVSIHSALFMYVFVHTHSYNHTHTHTYIHKSDPQTGSYIIHTYLHTHIHTYVQIGDPQTGSYIIHTYLHTYIHTIHTYT